MPTTLDATLSLQYESIIPHIYTVQATQVSLHSGKSNEKENPNEIRDSLLAGVIAGMTSCTLFHPFDVIRTKMQASTKISQYGALSSVDKLRQGQTAAILTNAAPSSIHSTQQHISSTSSPLQVISHTIRNGGLKAFYTGFSFPLMAQAAYKATVFTTNRLSQNFIMDTKNKEQQKNGIFTPYQLKLSDHFTCGAIAGFVNALLFVSPVEFIRNQLIAQHTLIAEGSLSKSKMMHGPLDVIRNTVKSKGILGLYTGTAVTLLRDSLGCGAFFVNFEIGKKYLPSITGHDPDSLIVSIGSGMMAGFGYWFASLPLDSLKTLVQTGKSTSALDTTKYLVERYGFYAGISQLYRGWQLAFGRGSPAAVVTLTTYSAVYSYCSNTLK